MDHPSYIFGFGRGGDLVKQEADVLLVAGSRLGNLDLPYDKYWGDGAGQKLVQIDIDPRNMGVTRPLALGIVADARQALEGLGAILRAMKLGRRDRSDLDRYRALARAWRDEQETPVKQWSGPGMHPAHALAVIGAVFGKDAVYVADGGNTALWAHSCLPATRPRSYHSILELGMLGTGIPQAIGAKLGAPDREIVCVTGDGAAGFNFMEMQSAAREKLEITTIVFAEGSWTMEEPNERLLYGRTFGTEQGTVRWDVVAQGLGCHGEYVEQIEDVAPALERARNASGPAVVCLRTSSEANLAIPAEMLARFFEVYQGPTA
jgi:acetolactate synthase-1/2/3 large subunit